MDELLVNATELGEPMTYHDIVAEVRSPTPATPSAVACRWETCMARPAPDKHCLLSVASHIWNQQLSQFQCCCEGKTNSY